MASVVVLFARPQSCLKFVVLRLRTPAPLLEKRLTKEGMKMAAALDASARSFAAITGVMSERSN